MLPGGLCYSSRRKFVMFFDFETVYHWGAIDVKLVPLFGIHKYKAHEDELIWVYDVNRVNDGYHVPARNLSTAKY